MMQNINITTPNGTNIYAVKAPSIPVPEYDYEQCSPSEAEGIAVLRYVPSVAEIVAGEYYANSSELIKYVPFTIEYNYIAVTSLNIYLKKHSDIAWLLYGKSIPASGQSTFALLPSDFIAGDDIDVKIEDADNATVLDIIENQHIYITITMETPTGVVAGEDYDYDGTSNGDEVELFYSPDDEDDWVSLGTSSVVDGDWTITGSIPDAGTYDYLAVDTTNENGFARVDDVVVGIGTLTMDASCTADAPENTTELIGTLTIDASCTADAPSNI